MVVGWQCFLIIRYFGTSIVQLKFRHVASRFITGISQKIWIHCTRLMKYVELRHIDNVTGYLGIKDLDEQFIYVLNGDWNTSTLNQPN